MGIMTVINAAQFGDFADFFTGTREDGTAMVFCFDELVEVVEHDTLCLLLCGDKLTANLPEYIGMTNEEYVALNREVAAMFPGDDWDENELLVAENEKKTQEYILCYK